MGPAQWVTPVVAREPGEGVGLVGRMRARLEAPVDIASLVAFRVLFGACLLGAVERFAARGWIDALYVQPAFHFPYEGFAWVRPLAVPWIYLHFVVLGLAALGLMLGAWYRLSALTLLVGFVWVELIDKTTWLNHYWLVTLLATLCVLLPLDGAASVDAWMGRARARSTVPAWMLYLVRFQLGVVYLFAGVAKLGPDWLVHGQPLRLWLAAWGELPLVGPWLAWPPTGLGMAWAGALFDLSVPWLLLTRLRGLAFAVLVVFHVVTGALFPIGVFPVLMVACSLVFFDPGWPRRFVDLAGEPAPVHERMGAWTATWVGAWVALQVLIPLRSHLMTDDVLWTERGFRFSWRVLIIEKPATIDYLVVDAETGGGRVVDPGDELTPWQETMMASQPDMILQYARHLAEGAAGRSVAVYADSWASLNGRPLQRYVDPTVDLARVEDGWGERWWVVPLEGGPVP